jgi:hypothetical protein
MATEKVLTEVFYHLKEQNLKHFGQKQTAPFTSIPLISIELGFNGQGHAADSLVVGRCASTNSMEDNVRLVLEHSKQSERIAAMDHKSVLIEVISEERVDSNVTLRKALIA